MLELMPLLPDGRALRVLCIGAHCDDVEIGCAEAFHARKQRFHPGGGSQP